MIFMRIVNKRFIINISLILLFMLFILTRCYFLAESLFYLVLESDNAISKDHMLNVYIIFLIIYRPLLFFLSSRQWNYLRSFLILMLLIFLYPKQLYLLFWLFLFLNFRFGLLFFGDFFRYSSRNLYWNFLL
jgi:hypothetical protein